MHPCRGSIDFGELSQESLLLGAIAQLEPYVQALFDKHRITDAQREAAAIAASKVIAQAESYCFFPQSGYCGSCGRDVVSSLEDIASAAAATGCRCCGSTWCD